jgi:hypothetical protein
MLVEACNILVNSRAVHKFVVYWVVFMLIAITVLYIRHLYIIYSDRREGETRMQTLYYMFGKKTVKAVISLAKGIKSAFEWKVFNIDE